MACTVSTPVLEASGDFPAWLEAQGVNAEVARAMDSELGIRDYGVLRACVGDGLVRAELLAAARDRLPFGFYAVLRQVVKALQGAEPHDGGTPSMEAFHGVDAVLSSLVDVLVMLFSGLSRELSLSVHRLGAMEGSVGNEGSTIPTRVIRFGHRCSEEQQQQQQLQPQQPVQQEGLAIQTNQSAAVIAEPPLARLPMETSVALDLCGHYSPISSATSEHGITTDDSSRLEEVVDDSVEREPHTCAGEASELLQEVEEELDQPEPQNLGPVAEGHATSYDVPEREGIEAMTSLPLSAAGAHGAVQEPQDAAAGACEEELTFVEEDSIGGPREGAVAGVSPTPVIATATNPNMETMEAAASEGTGELGDPLVRPATSASCRELDEQMSGKEESPIDEELPQMEKQLPAPDANNSSSNSSWEDLVAVAVNLAIGTNLTDWKEQVAEAETTPAMDARKTPEAPACAYQEESATVASKSATDVNDPSWDEDCPVAVVPAIVPNQPGRRKESGAAGDAPAIGTRGSVLVECAPGMGSHHGEEVQEVAIDLAIGSRHSEHHERAAIGVPPPNDVCDPPVGKPPTDVVLDLDTNARVHRWKKRAAVATLPGTSALRQTWTELMTTTTSSSSNNEKEPREVAEAPVIATRPLAWEDRGFVAETPATSVLAAGPATKAHRPWPREWTSAAEHPTVVTSRSMGWETVTSPPAREAQDQDIEMLTTGASSCWQDPGDVALNLAKGRHRPEWREEVTAVIPPPKSTLPANSTQPEKEQRGLSLAPTTKAQDARWMELRAMTATPAMDARLALWARPEAAMRGHEWQPNSTSGAPATSTQRLGQSEQASDLRLPPATNTHGSGLQQLVATAVDLAVNTHVEDLPATSTHGPNLPMLGETTSQHQETLRSLLARLATSARCNVQDDHLPAIDTQSPQLAVSGAMMEPPTGKIQSHGWEELLAVAVNLASSSTARPGSRESAEMPTTTDEHHQQVEEMRSQEYEEEEAAVVMHEEDPAALKLAPTIGTQNSGWMEDLGAVTVASVSASGPILWQEATTATTSVHQEEPRNPLTNIGTSAQQEPRDLAEVHCTCARSPGWLEPAAVIGTFKEPREALPNEPPAIADTTMAAVVHGTAWQENGAMAELPGEETDEQGSRPHSPITTIHTESLKDLLDVCPDSTPWQGPAGEQRVVVELPSKSTERYGRVDYRPLMQIQIGNVTHLPVLEEQRAVMQSPTAIMPQPVPEIRTTVAKLLATSKPSDEPIVQTTAAELAVNVIPCPVPEKLNLSTTITPSHGPEKPGAPAEKTATSTPSHGRQDPKSVAELLTTIAPSHGPDKDKSVAELATTQTPSLGPQEQKCIAEPATNITSSQGPENDKSVAHQQGMLEQSPMLEMPVGSTLRIPVLRTLGSSTDPLIHSILKKRPLSEIPMDGPARIPVLRTPGVATSRQRQELRVLLERPIMGTRFSSGLRFEHRAIKEVPISRIHSSGMNSGGEGTMSESQSSGGSHQHGSLVDKLPSGRHPRNITRVQQRPIMEISIGDIYPQMFERSTSTSTCSTNTSSTISISKQQQKKSSTSARHHGSDQQESELELTAAGKQSSTTSGTSTSSVTIASTSNISSSKTSISKHLPQLRTLLEKPATTSHFHIKDQQVPTLGSPAIWKQGSGHQMLEAGTTAHLLVVEEVEAPVAKSPASNVHEEKAKAQAPDPTTDSTREPGRKEQASTAAVPTFAVDRRNGPSASTSACAEGLRTAVGKPSVGAQQEPSGNATESFTRNKSRPLWDELVAVAVNLRDSEQQEQETMSRAPAVVSIGSPDGRKLVAAVGEPATNSRCCGLEMQGAAMNMQQQQQQQQQQYQQQRGMVSVAAPALNLHSPTYKEAAVDMSAIGASQGGGGGEVGAAMVEPTTIPIYHGRDGPQATTSFTADGDKDMEGFVIQNMGSSQGTRFLLLQTAWLHQSMLQDSTNQDCLNVATVISPPTNVWPPVPSSVESTCSAPPPPPPPPSEAVAKQASDANSDSDDGGGRDKPQLRCVDCGRMFHCHEYLYSHMKLHTGAPGYPCAVCGQVYMTEVQVNAHERRRHPAERPHRCSVCDRMYPEGAALRAHMRQHAGERPHVCTVCGRSFTQMSNLRRHHVVHTGERPHVCAVCGRSFALHEDAVVHERAHAGPRPHVCDECGRGFTYYCELKIHMRKHTGERPHKCDVCGKAFAQLSNYKRHRIKCQGSSSSLQAKAADGNGARPGGLKDQEPGENRIESWTHDLQDAYIQHKKARMSEHEESRQQQQSETRTNEPTISQMESNDPRKSESRGNVRKRKKPVKKIRPEDMPQPK
ncbi:uncharacterized protein LOC144953091 [Lampetra fluviatilis]